MRRSTAENTTPGLVARNSTSCRRKERLSPAVFVSAAAFAAPACSISRAFWISSSRVKRKFKSSLTDRVRSRAWYWANREISLARSTAWRVANRDKMRAHQARWMVVNRERLLIFFRSDKKRKYNRNWARAHPVPLALRRIRNAARASQCKAYQQRYRQTVRETKMQLVIYALKTSI